MPFVVKDRVKVTSTTTGTGTFTLGAAVDGFQDFSVIGAEIPQAWNIGVASYSGISFSVASQETAPQGLFFKPDGTKMYITGNTGDDVNEYSLSTPWLVSSASYVQAFVLTGGAANPDSLFFSNDGLRMYVAASLVYQYDLSSAWDVSTASYVQNYNPSAEETSLVGLFFKPDGTKMYISGTSGDDVNEYDLSIAWDISTSVYLQNFSVSAQDSAPVGLSFKPDGTKMYVLGGSGDDLNEYILSSAWNISTASYVQNFPMPQDDSAVGIFFRPNGLNFYMVGFGNDTVYQYNITTENQTYYAITDGTDWEVGIGSVSYDGTTLSRDTILESSNSNAAVNWGAGAKNVFCTYPADATEGTVPQGDTSQVGTDLVAWTNLKKTLDAGVVNGVPYANNNTNGIVSTYSLVYTRSGSDTHNGGVLAQNGDIHFVPREAVRGQKINYLTGVVSTYSLVYTVGEAYAGGVLASNGDIHFVPHNANRGQKVSAAGVVSTYSLVYTGSQNYNGGVLAPNGDIHFIPQAAAVGQKISASGVVSTYSLVYTAPAAYAGGVLAPNGDIHFVPYGAVRGQKISAAGVVSTYSLVYTVSTGYYGGVLAPNGDIHFVPGAAVRGQKISAAGVVSTYSLVYTVNDAYRGGVLAPNGDIHFVPYSGDKGQKVSPVGVVSTYSFIAPGVSRAYVGGILTPSGDIYFIPGESKRGQKISTGTQRNIGYALSPFFNKL